MGIGRYIDRFLEEYSAIISYVAGTVLIGISGSSIHLFSVNNGHLYRGAGFILGASALIAGARLTYKTNKKIESLKIENDNLRESLKESNEDLYSIWHDELSEIRKQLDLFDHGRISLYKHERLGKTKDPKGAFIMVGRHSLSYDFEQHGRGMYPASEGCIGRAFSNGEFFDASLPDPNYKRRYIRHVSRKHNMDKETVANLSMHPRSIAAFAIRDTNKRRRIGVVVFESKKENGLDVDKLRDMVDNRLENRLSKRLEQNDLVPSLAYSRGRGV